MFKDEKDFEEIVNRLNIDTNPNSIHREKLKQQMLSAFNEISQKQTTPFGVLRKKFMRNPIKKLAAAAIIILGLLILFIYSSSNQNSQNNEDTYIVRQDNNDNEIETPDTRGEYDDLMLAKQLFEKKDITGLSQLLSSEFEPVQLLAAEYLRQIGDESVLAELQVLADQWKILEQENVFKEAISAIKERLAGSESEAVQEPLETVINQIPVEPIIEPNEIQTGVTGIVIDKDTLQPIQGAFVGFQKDRGTNTDANGCFTFTDPIFQLFLEGDSEEIPFVIMASTYASKEMRVRMEKGKMADVTIKLSSGSKINGKVLDSDDNPVPNAEVSVRGFARASFPVITDTEGIFEIDGVDPAYSSPRINVHHSVFPSVSIDFKPAPAGQSIYKEIILKSGITVFGQVTDSQGKPIQGVTVGNTDSPQMWNVKKYETDQEGMYVLDNVDAGKLTLWAVHNRFGLFVMRTTLDLSQAQQQIDIQLSEPYVIKGSVLDSQGNPIPETYVVMDEYNGVINIDQNFHSCNQDGTFVIPNAPGNGELTLHVYGQGISSITHKVNFEQEEQIITAELSGKIYGEVIDAMTGKPIPKFTVKMTFTRTGVKGGGYRSSWAELGHTFNSPDGYFDSGTDDLAVNSHYRITIIAEGYDPITDDLVPVQQISNNPERTQFLLQPATLRVGRVVNIEGKPIEGATIIFYPNENVSYDEVLPRTITDKEGIYSILGLGSEYQIMEVNAPAYTPNVLLLEDISLPDSQFKDITLDHGVSLSGFVFDDKGTGIADVAISVYIDPVKINNIRTRLVNVGYGARTDENGFYQVQGVPSGKLLVIASSTQYYHRKKIEIKPSKTMQLNFGDEEGFIISGITKAGQRQLEKAVVYLLSSEGEVLRRVITDAQGKFRLYYVEQNSYKLKVAWSSNISSEPEKLPEGTNFEIERKLKIEENIELNIDMQAETVTDTKTGQVIKDD